MKLRPLGDYVIVKPLKEDAVTKSGIVLPDTVDKEKPEKGEVLAVGPGKWDEDGEKRVPMSVKVGDKVVFKKYSPDEFRLNPFWEIDGDSIFFLSESDIIAVID